MRMKTAGSIIVSGLLAGALSAGLCTGCKTKGARKNAKAKGSITSREAAEIATDAYIFGFPLVMMDLNRQVMTNVREPEGMRAPMGQVANVRDLPLPSTRDARVPNADTLATSVWLDVSREPWVLSFPDLKDRYAVFSVFDGWSTVVASLGKRTSGTGAQKYVISGPGWKGKLPHGVKRLKSPTSLVWMLGRIYCTGTPEDCAAVHALQDQISATPLSSYGKAYTPPPAHVNPTLDMRKPVIEQVNKLGCATYFNWLATLMKDNPPTPEDLPLVKKMARLGLVPGKPFNIGQLDPAVIEVLESVPNTARSKVSDWLKQDTKVSNLGDWKSEDGWKWTLKTGVYGTDYIQRALVAAIGLGANLPQDTLVAASTVDAAGEPYSGNFRYGMHFPPGQAPSANGFWSLTMYDSDLFLVSNPLSRFSLNARDHFKFNLDGSLDLYLQQHPPGAEMESNWLPAPEGKFTLILRFYWPKDAMFKANWKIPPVKRED
jgi:hypothetical protein